VTTLISKRPFESRSKVAVMRAAAVGEMMPGLIATKNFRRLVAGIRLDATTHASSHERPVGSSAPL